jgi:WD40 repeat protein
MKKIIIVILLVCSWNVFALYLPQSIRDNKQLQLLVNKRQQQRIKLEQAKNIPADSLLIRSKGAIEGVIIKKDDAIRCSELIAGMLEGVDLGNMDKVIELEPIDGKFIDKQTIQNFFDICNKKQVNILNLDHLTKIANIMDYMGGTPENRERVLNKIKSMTQSKSSLIIEPAFDQFSSDIKKASLLGSTMEMLNGLIIKKFSHREQISKLGASSIAFQPHGDIIAYGSVNGRGNQYGDFEMSGKTVFRHPQMKKVHSVAFSSDGAYVVVAGERSFDGCNMFVYKCSNGSLISKYDMGANTVINTAKFIPNTTMVIYVKSHFMVKIVDVLKENILNKDGFLCDLGKGINCIECSPNGKFIVKGSKTPEQENKEEPALVIWDVSNIDYNDLFLTNEPNKAVNDLQIKGVKAVAINRASNKIAAICCIAKDSVYNTLILIDVTNINAMTYQVLKKYDCKINSIAFDAEQSFLVVGLDKTGENIELFDVVDKNNIVSNLFVGSDQHVDVAVFDSMNSNRIVVGRDTGTYNYILRPAGNVDRHPGGVIFSVTLCSKEQRAAINDVRKCNGDQLLFISKLCVNQSQLEKVTVQEGTSDYNLFMQLPNSVQQLLKDLSLVAVEYTGQKQPQQNESWFWKWAREKKDQLHKLARGYMQYAG